MDITYLGHSGFAARTDARLLVFDHLGEGLPDPAEGDRAIAFVSHAHSDHFHPIVSRWLREGRARLVVGMDVRSDGESMRPGEARVIDGARVEAFGSTDAGVSFLVTADGARVFHAGDFNFWHWRAESTEAEVREAERAFERVLDSLRGREMDVAFFPVDPRMGDGYDEGALRFAEAIRPRVLIPMHFWDRPQAARAFAARTMPDGVRAVALTEPGASITLR